MDAFFFVLFLHLYFKKGLSLGKRIIKLIKNLYKRFIKKPQKQLNNILYTSLTVLRPIMTSQTRIKTQERRSNSFSALKKSNYDQDNQDFSIVTSQIQANTNKSSKFASLKDMGNKPNSTFVTSRTTIDKKPTHNGLSCIPTVSSSAANSLTFKDQQQQQKQSILEPINETPEDKLEKLLSSLSGKLTETDIQEMLLSYTYTSGEIDDKLISNIISNANYRKKKEPNSIKIKFKSVWSHTIFTTIDVAERIEEKMFELFWVLIVNLDLWFPKIASVVRYVSIMYLFHPSSLQYRLYLLTKYPFI